MHMHSLHNYVVQLSGICVCRGYPGTQQTPLLFFQISLGLGLVAPVTAVAFPHFDFRLSSGTRKNCFFSWRKPVLQEVTWILVTFSSVSALFIEVSRCLNSHWKEISWWLPTCSSLSRKKLYWNHKIFPAASFGWPEGAAAAQKVWSPARCPTLVGKRQRHLQSWCLGLLCSSASQRYWWKKSWPTLAAEPCKCR